jgi:hypothetical protein
LEKKTKKKERESWKKNEKMQKKKRGKNTVDWFNPQ